MRKYHDLDLAIDRLVDNVESRFSCFSLFYRKYWSIFKFQINSTKILLRKNIDLSFEVTKHKESYMSSLFEQKKCAQDVKS